MDYLGNLVNMCSNIVDDVTDSVVKGDFSNLASDIRHQTDNFLGGGGHSGYAGQPNDGVYMPGAGAQQRGDGGVYRPGGSQGGPSGYGAQQNSGTGQSQARPQQNMYGVYGAGAGFDGGGAYRSGNGLGQGARPSWNAQENLQQTMDNYRKRAKNQVAPFMRRRPGKGRGTFLSILGGAGLVIFGLSMLGSIMIASIGGAIACGVFTGLSLAGVLQGSKTRKLINKFYRYAGIVGGREYADIHELAYQTADTDEEVRRSLNQMMEKKMLPPAVYDDQYTTLLLTDNARNQYNAAKNARMAREQEAARAREEASRPQSENQQVMSDGQRFINEIQDAKRNITDDDMKQKLDRLENVVNRIFSQVGEHPETAADMRKFMNYYIPTTNKLIDAYEQLDRQPEGENVSNTKKEIEDAVDALTSAYERMLDKMFENVAWDISSDISVMKSMLAQDGLADEGTFSADTEGKDGGDGGIKLEI